MKQLGIIYITLLYFFMLGMALPTEVHAQNKKKQPVRTSVQNQASKGRKRIKSKSVNKRRSSRKPRGKAQPKRSIGFEVVRQERRHLDSLRLHNGGIRPIRVREELLPVEIEPLMARFRRADTTMSSDLIAQLYYSNHAKTGEGVFLTDIEKEADRHISASRYADALKTVRLGLFRNPMYFPLVKRACDLAQHERDPEVDIYLWQIVELFVAVDLSGDGKTPETAYEVMGISDALLFETLWLETSKENIMRRESNLDQTGRALLTLEIIHEGKKELRYYRLPLER